MKAFRRFVLSVVLCLFGAGAPAWAACPAGYGDLDNSGSHDVVDVQCGILATLWELGSQAGPAPTCLAGAPDVADVDCNGTVTVVDVQLLISLALGLPLSASVDPNGNGCADTCETAVPQPPQAPGDLVITEIMQNPAAVGDNMGEWFEIYNATDHDIDLQGVVIRDDSSASEMHTIGASVVVAPGAYAVLGNNADTATNGGVAVDYAYDTVSLGNSSDGIVLEYNGVVIDQVVWDNGATFPDPSGASMSLDPAALDATANDDGSNWCEGYTPYGDGDLGTPGAANPACPVCGNGVIEAAEQCDDGANNSDTLPDACRTDCTLAHCGDGVVDTGEQCDDGANNSDVVPDACRTDCTAARCGDGIVDTGEECDDGNTLDGDGCSSTCTLEAGATPILPGDLVITEIMQNPYAVGDLQGEWFEVYNATDHDLDLAGLVIRDDDVPSEAHIVSSSVVVPVGGYAVLGLNGDTATNGGVSVDYVYDTVTLGNGSDGLVLEYNGAVVDEVVWDNGATFPDPSGASMSLDPNFLDATANDDGSHWCAATVPYGDGDLGTPGAANPACPVCGNGVVEGGEQCDDGPNNSDTTPDACRTDCTLAHCGDGVVDTGEECDDGANNSDSTPDACRTSCMAAYCGDGVVDTGEECDDGNNTGGDGCSATCTLEQMGAIGPGDLVITEVMQNPAAVSDGKGEWFEVYNATDHDIDLQGVVIRDDSVASEMHTIGASVVVAPGAYAVLGNNADMATNGGVAVDYAYDTVTLGNGSDGIVLEYNGVVIDQVVWDNGATFPDPVGASMSLDPTALDATANDDGSNWCEGYTPYGDGDLGTPGAANPACPVCGNGVVEGNEECDDGPNNSDTTPDACRTDCTLPHCGDAVVDTGEECDDGPNNSDSTPDACRTDCTAAHCGDGVVDTGEECDDGNTLDGDGCSSTCTVEAGAQQVSPGDIIITEIMQNPAAVADSAGEWFEVYNTTDHDIDLVGFVLRDDSSANEFHTVSSSVVVSAGGYAVLGVNGDTATNGGVTVDYVYDTFFLGNGSDGIILEYQGTVIDQVVWDNGATFPDPSGASMSLDPAFFDATANDDGSHWCEAVDPYGAGDLGTPGAANPPCGGSAAAPTWATDMQPIFQAKCSPCHVGTSPTMCSSGACFGSHYDAALQAANNAACQGLSVYECIPVRLGDGSMPLGAGCTGDPTLDAGNASCLTAAEWDLLNQWVAAGAP